MLAAVLLLLAQCDGQQGGTPTLTVETPQKLSAADTEEFSLDVTISDLGDVRYPAMSMSISFDASRLEFLGVEEGNVFVHDDESNHGQQHPMKRKVLL